MREQRVRAVDRAAVVARDEHLVAVAADRRSRARPSAASRRGGGTRPRARPRPRGPCTAAPAGATRSAYTCEPSALNMCVNSTPVTPEPITTRCSGISGGGYAWRVVRMRSPSIVAQSGTRGREPVDEQDRVGLDLLDAVVGRRPRPCTRPTSRPVPRMRRTPCDSSRLVTPVAQLRPPCRRCARAARRRRGGRDASSPIVLARRELGQLVAGRDHRLARDAVPEVRGAADDVALDQRHLGAERRGDGRRGVAGGTATDDHEAHGHAVQATRRGPPSLTVRCSNSCVDELTGDARDRRARRAHCGPTRSAFTPTRCPRRVADVPVLPRATSTRRRPRSRASAPARPTRRAGTCASCRTCTRSSATASPGAHEVVDLLARARPPTSARSPHRRRRPTCWSRCATAPRFHLAAGLRARAARSSTRARRRARRSSIRTRSSSRSTSCRRASTRARPLRGAEPRPRARRDRRGTRRHCVVGDGDVVGVVPARVDDAVRGARRAAVAAARASTRRPTTTSARVAERAARRARAPARDVLGDVAVQRRVDTAPRDDAAAVPLVGRHRAPRSP